MNWYLPFGSGMICSQFFPSPYHTSGVCTPGSQLASVTCTVCGAELAPSLVVMVRLVGLTEIGCVPPGGGVIVYLTGMFVRPPFEPSSGMLPVYVPFGRVRKVARNPPSV